MNSRKPYETRSREELVDACQVGAAPKFVFFWGHTPKTSDTVGKECFSQWYPAEFVLDGLRYATAEHYMMAQKARLFGDDEAYEKVLAASRPGEAKAIGRAVRNFDETQWSAHSFDIVVDGNVGKFGQNPELGDFLLATRRRVLVEASPRDRIWGIGMTEHADGADQPQRWKGLNKLGFALMEARARLAASED